MIGDSNSKKQEITIKLPNTCFSFMSGNGHRAIHINLYHKESPRSTTFLIDEEFNKVGVKSMEVNNLTL